MKRSTRLLVGILVWLVGCGASTTGPGQTSSPVQPPIDITFDLHCDPLPVLTPDARRAVFRQQVQNAQWLLDFVEPYGAKVSFLAVGEFYEYCVEPTEQAACFALLQRLAASGGIVATHQHCQYQRAAHDWPDIAACTRDPDPIDVRRVWEDGHRMTDEAVRQALGLSDPAAIAAVNTAAESHAQLVDANQLMEEYGYTIREGGGDQILVAIFKHVPWNPFRPGNGATAEDLTTSFVTIPQGMVIGHVGLHLGLWQDGSPPRKKAEFLELYAEWLDRERSGAEPKVWSFGWGVHTQDLDDGSDSRAAIMDLVPWLHEQFVARTSPAGHPVARFAGYVEARDDYLAWEQAHPGVSSFDYAIGSSRTPDYTRYPYLEWANRMLRETRFDAERTAPEGVRLFALTAGETYPLLLATAGASTATVDASSLGGATVRRVELASGATSNHDAAAVAVGPGSSVLCVPADCDAILALGSTSPMPDGGVPDGGLPEGGPSSCAGGAACPTGTVCCTAPLPCADLCVPDCRIDAGPGCPALAPNCDPTTGLCSP